MCSLGGGGGGKCGPRHSQVMGYIRRKGCLDSTWLYSRVSKVLGHTVTFVEIIYIFSLERN